MSDVSLSTPTPTESTPNDLQHSYAGWARQLGMVLALAALADWLFYGHAIGISAMAFLIALDAGVVLANPRCANRRDTLIALGVLIVSIVPLAVEISILSVLFGALGAAYFALATTRSGESWIDRVRDSIALLLDGTWQAAADICKASQSWAKGAEPTRRLGGLVVWVVPLALGTIFVLLFVAANPLIEEWFAAFDFRRGAAKISFVRIGFWLAALSLIWPFIFMRARSMLREHAAAEVRAFAVMGPDIGPSPGLLLGKGAVLRSLLLFNALFAVQTVLDITYLWGGVALPEAMTYAAYAHRGAYPLIVTALLAAAFVIMTMRPGSEAERSPLIRTLVFLWTGQNVLLVISSILRLDLYVAFYSLTYWRVAAFVWMLLVAAGLMLIVARIALGRSNSWLVTMNFGSLALALYICCFINFPQLIANYNVEHSRQLSGTGTTIDTAYLVSLGPQAIPAMDKFFLPRREFYTWSQELKQRNAFAASHNDRMQDWRGWTYRNWKLMQYLQREGIVRP